MPTAGAGAGDSADGHWDGELYSQVVPDTSRGIHSDEVTFEASPSPEDYGPEEPGVEFYSSELPAPVLGLIAKLKRWFSLNDRNAD